MVVGGLKTGGGEGQHKKKRENEWMSRGLKTGVANRREKRENERNSRGLKTGGGTGQPKEKRETNGLVGAKTRGQGGPT